MELKNASTGLGLNEKKNKMWMLEMSGGRNI
jgi:hypothetical protein